MKQAFTMMELIFVIVIIGIISAIAIPKFSETSDIAYTSKAKSELSSVMSAISTFRQKQILQGLADTGVTDLGDATNAFSVFNGGSTEVLQIPVRNCVGTATACWIRAVSDGARTFTYRFSGGGDAQFILNNNRLRCVATDTADCEKLQY